MWLVFFLGIGLGLLVTLAGQLLPSLAAPEPTVRIKPQALSLVSLIWFVLTGSLLPSARTPLASQYPSAQQCH